ncbi:Na(+)-translocating NADH-quinone reductase subunit A [Verrucomicrobiota bacterium]
MSNFKIKKGFDIKLAGKPSLDVVDWPNSGISTLYPLEFTGVKQRLKVKEGDVIARGAELLEDKRNERFKICAPAGGNIKSIIRGARRFVEEIIIEVDTEKAPVQFKNYQLNETNSVTREDIIDQLLRTGYLSLIKQRPFSQIADIKAKPKSIFVNGMNTAPFQANADVVVEDDTEGFQAGLNLLTQLTDGAVHLCVSTNSRNTIKSVENVQVHTFSGPHPSGNTSVHISRIDPIKPTDIVWTVKAVDLLLIGRLFLDGVLPASRIISIGGPGIKEEGRKHYRMNIGGELEPLFSRHIQEGEQRVINGDILSGTKIEQNGGLRLHQSSITVIPEGRERRFLGWTMPGFNLLSFTRTVASSWLGGKKSWTLNSNMNGSVRAMVLTGHYDKIMPLNIMVDFLVRAVLAKDTDEAISLGILETDPEDFALCEFICPSKMELQDIIRKGLADIEEEGI